MKKRLLHLIQDLFAFILFATVIYLVLIYLWGTYVPDNYKLNLFYPLGSPGHTFTRLNEVKRTNNIDILFIGSSHAYRGFDTRIFLKAGFKSFNLGTSSQTPIQTKILLDRYLDHLSPDLIVLEVYPATFSMDGIESSLDLIANDRNDWNSLKMCIATPNMKVLNTLLYSCMRELFDLNRGFNEHIRIGNDTYISGGYVEKELLYFKQIEHPRTEIIFNETQTEIFDKIISLIKGRSISLVLVNAPITKALYNSYTNNLAFDSLMISKGKYYNFNQILNLHDSLNFYDPDHLNQSGVEIFNHKLIEIMQKDGLIRTFKDSIGE